MSIDFDSILPYLDSLVPARAPAMQEMEAHAAETGFPIIGPAAGNFCYQMARLMGARRVFELGSGYGYSTAWFAAAVQDNGGGEVHHTVWDEDLSRRARKYLGELGYGGLVNFREAVQALRETPGPFDLIFNDIDKEGYPASLPVIADKLRPGGLLIIDNMLWSGRVLTEDDNSSATTGIRRLTAMLTGNGDWSASLVPIRDGLMLAVKK
jgi:predicted O-methyltransferase YrrM